MEKIYNKLVRDNIPNLIANDNEEVFTSTLTIEEYQEALLNKLQEEATEVKKAKTKKEILDLQREIENLEKKKIESQEIKLENNFNKNRIYEEISMKILTFLVKT